MPTMITKMKVSDMLDVNPVPKDSDIVFVSGFGAGKSSRLQAANNTLQQEIDLIRKGENGERNNG